MGSPNQSQPRCTGATATEAPVLIVNTFRTGTLHPSQEAQAVQVVHPGCILKHHRMQGLFDQTTHDTNARAQTQPFINRQTFSDVGSNVSSVLPVTEESSRNARQKLSK